MAFPRFSLSSFSFTSSRLSFSPVGFSSRRRPAATPPPPPSRSRQPAEPFPHGLTPTANLPRSSSPAHAVAQLADREVAMGTTETQQKAGLPLIVKLDKGLKLAEQWINTMTKVAEDEPTEVELEARPYRLGLGAKVSRQSKVGPSNDPLERKLYAKLNNGKRKASKSANECMLSARDGGDDDSDAEENLDSRTTAFDKKRAGASKTAFLQANKKHK